MRTLTAPGRRRPPRGRRAGHRDRTGGRRRLHRQPDAHRDRLGHARPPRRAPTSAPPPSSNRACRPPRAPPPATTCTGSSPPTPARTSPCTPPSPSPARRPGTAPPPGRSTSTTACAAASPAATGCRPRSAAPDAASVELACHLRTIRSWAEPWSNDPLRGAYYVRLTVLDLPSDRPRTARPGRGARPPPTAPRARQAVDGSVAPVVTANGPRVAPSGGWAGTWWSARWLWTGGGGLLAVLLALGAHRLARGPVLLPAPLRAAGYDRPREPAGYAD